MRPKNTRRRTNRVYWLGGVGLSAGSLKSSSTGRLRHHHDGMLVVACQRFGLFSQQPGQRVKLAGLVVLGPIGKTTPVRWLDRTFPMSRLNASTKQVEYRQ